MMYRGVTGPELSSCLEIGKHYLAMHSSLLCSHTNCLRMHYRNQRSHFISASAACLCKKWSEWEKGAQLSPHSCPPPMDDFLSLHPSWLTLRRAIFSLSLSSLRKKYPCHIGLASPLLLRIFSGMPAPFLYQYFQNVQVSK